MQQLPRVIEGRLSRGAGGAIPPPKIV